MKYNIMLIALAASANAVTQTLYGQCGGATWTGATACPTSAYCSTQNSFYAQCITGTSTSSSSSSSTLTTSTTTTTTTTTTPGPMSSASLYGQCGGVTWTGATVCITGASCSTQNTYYAQCEPATGTTTTTITTTTTTTTTTSTTISTTPPVSPATGVPYAGINIAGCEFQCNTTGNCIGPYYCPTSSGPTQMQHFVQDDGLNMFRIPLGWQYLVDNIPGGAFDQSYFSTYDSIVQSCLSYSGTKCIIDVHNYARWNNQIIGQGGPTDAQFADLWTELATHYAATPDVIFGIMNEPWGLNMTVWANTVQAVVKAIRAAGATSQLILLPGTSFTSVTAFVSESAPFLSGVVDADGSTSKLIYDVHQYFDVDGSGTNWDCVTDHVSDAFTGLTAYLKQNGRQALLSETGGTNKQSCLTYVCNALDHLNANAGQYLGWIGWGAGSFDTGYTLTETPNGDGSDQAIVSTCISGKFGNKMK